MDIDQRSSGEKGEFYIEENGDSLAKLQYIASGPGEMTIYHTEVDDKLRGQHIGDKLVKKAVEFARSKGLKIVPQCPFARKVIERTAEYQDVLA